MVQNGIPVYITLFWLDYEISLEYVPGTKQ